MYEIYLTGNHYLLEIDGKNCLVHHFSPFSRLFYRLGLFNDRKLLPREKRILKELLFSLEWNQAYIRLDYVKTFDDLEQFVWEAKVIAEFGG